MPVSLPAAFSDLAPWAQVWVLPNERARRDLRCQSSMEALQAFYDAMLARMDAIIGHLNTYPLDAMPEPERNLLDLARAFLEAAPAVELFHAPEVPDGFPWQRFTVHG
jgi:hypothetical protein